MDISREAPGGGYTDEPLDEMTLDHHVVILEMVWGSWGRRTGVRATEALVLSGVSAGRRLSSVSEINGVSLFGYNGDNISLDPITASEQPDSLWKYIFT